ncbi:MAG: VOC family protein [bacterium]|nr:VOC family protein [bacterium]
MPTPGTLHHVELYVADLQRSLSFWRWFLLRLGYSEYQSWEEGCSFRLGDTYLVFVQVAEHHRKFEYHRCHPGLNHLAFHAKSRAEVDQLTIELQQRGIEILYPECHPNAGGEGYYAVFFEDPDRMKVEFVAPDITE